MVAKKKATTTIDLSPGSFAFVIKPSPNDHDQVVFEFEPGPQANTISPALCASLAIRSFLRSSLFEEMARNNLKIATRLGDGDE